MTRHLLCRSRLPGASVEDEPRVRKYLVGRLGRYLNNPQQGDHPSYDVAGGKNANLNTIRIGHHHQLDTPLADHHFASVLDAFPTILAG